MAGCLHVVATPIGNLDDITCRAAKVLAEVETIAAEDTRRTGALLRHLGLPTRKLLSLHDHNEAAATQRLLETDCAPDRRRPWWRTPASRSSPTPGFELVRRCWEQGRKGRSGAGRKHRYCASVRVPPACGPKCGSSAFRRPRRRPGSACCGSCAVVRGDAVSRSAPPRGGDAQGRRRLGAAAAGCSSAGK